MHSSLRPIEDSKYPTELHTHDAISKIPRLQHHSTRDLMKSLHMKMKHQEHAFISASSFTLELHPTREMLGFCDIFVCVTATNAVLLRNEEKPLALTVEASSVFGRIVGSTGRAANTGHRRILFASAACSGMVLGDISDGHARRDQRRHRYITIIDWKIKHGKMDRRTVRLW